MISSVRAFPLKKRISKILEANDHFRTRPASTAAAPTNGNLVWSTVP